MAVTLAAEGMLKALKIEDEENVQETKKEDHDLETVLRYFDKMSKPCHPKIRYSDGQVRETSL